MPDDSQVLYALWSHMFNVRGPDRVSPRMMSELLQRVDRSGAVLQAELKRVTEVCDILPDDVVITFDPCMCLRALERAGTF